MIRDDGSIRSSNLPVWDNRAKVRDYGIYRGFVHDVIYTDDANNDSGLTEPNEVLYQVVLIGGDRDGQVFTNARLMRGLGGFSNYEEVSLKKAEGITKQDYSSLIAIGDLPISNTATLNGDVVYLQFLNGDPGMPVIVGMGYHQKAETEATKADGPRYKRKYNGIYTEITKDGEFTWSKDNGAYVPIFPNTSDPLYPLVSQFAPLPGQEQAIKVSIDNQYNFKMEYLLGLNMAISGLDDSFKFTTTTGTVFNILGGPTDTVSALTVLGTSIKIEGGATDAITLGTAVGATAKIDGKGDEISFKVAFGDSLSISAKNGIQASTPTGTALSMKTGEVSISSGGGAKLVLDKAGFIKLGNSSGDVLKDVLQKLIESLSTATYSGFGAPGSNVADLIQLLTKMPLFTGG